MTAAIDFIEMRIIEAVKKLLCEAANEILEKTQLIIPKIEFGDYSGQTTIVPTISLATCERTEKERILRIDAYTLTISFEMPETHDTVYLCYAYAFAICKAINENPSLDGIADRAVFVGKNYQFPKKRNCGDNWSLVTKLRITVAGENNAG